jgi:threonine aldolase
MTARLYTHIKDLQTIKIVAEVQTNAIFARIPSESITPLTKVAKFYDGEPFPGVVRWMTSWQTTEDEVDTFAEAIKNELA